MDLTLVMNLLRPNENVSPDLSSYEVMVENWRGAGSPPSLKEVEEKWAEIKKIVEDEVVDVKRESEYPTIKELTVALWELTVLKTPESQAKVDALQAEREKVQTDNPK